MTRRKKSGDVALNYLALGAALVPQRIRILREMARAVSKSSSVTALSLIAKTNFGVGIDAPEGPPAKSLGRDSHLIGECSARTRMASAARPLAKNQDLGNKNYSNVSIELNTSKFKRVNKRFVQRFC